MLLCAFYISDRQLGQWLAHRVLFLFFAHGDSPCSPLCNKTAHASNLATTALCGGIGSLEESPQKTRFPPRAAFQTDPVPKGMVRGSIKEPPTQILHVRAAARIPSPGTLLRTVGML